MDGNVNSLRQGNPINDSHGNSPVRHSTFNGSYSLANTLRFAELTPHFALRCVAGDKISLSSSHQLRTFTFKAPFMNNIELNKSYFSVPMEAILPFNWEKIYTNPNLGDDVPSDAYTSVDSFLTKYASYLNQVRDWVHDADDTEDAMRYFLFYLIAGEYIFSNGSLLNVLGKNFTKRWSSDDEYTSWDARFDLVVADMIDKIQQMDVEVYGTRMIVSSVADIQDNVNYYVSWREFFDILRDNGGYCMVHDVLMKGARSFDIQTMETWIQGDNIKLYTNEEPLDLAPLFAYQIICAHYFSNDKVDYVYSAELYRQNLSSAISGTYGLLDYFDYNGLRIPYDYTSSYYFNTLFDGTYPIADIASYLSLIFAYRSSLRFVDYFSGAKTRPLAVGDVNVSVEGGNVSVVDVTRKIQLQRFLNSVNRSGRKISNYVKELFGVSQAPDYHNPFYLGSTKDNLFGDETSNTGANQLTDPNSVTSVMKSNSSKYAFDIDVDRESIIIGLTFFDCKRMYPYASDRMFYMKDRFDFFNPFMEHIGDQPIYHSELTSSKHPFGPLSPFAYQTRNMDMKQRINRACGGFVENLPGYAFIPTDSDSYFFGGVITPSFIRSHNTELDSFFASLTSYSLGGYFHFIVEFVNNCDMKRPMSYNPNIL